MPSLITMSIPATRMYRALSDFIPYNNMYATAPSRHPRELIVVSITLAEMARITRRRLIP